MTGGVVPLSATVVRTPRAEVWNERPFLHGHTYSNHALGCAAAAAAIKVYRDDHLVRRSAELGEYALERAHELKEKHRSIGDVRGKGLFVGLELVKDRASKQPLVTSSRSGPSPKEKVLAQAMDEGVYMMPGQGTVLFVAPPLNISRAELDQALEVLDAALELADAEADG